MRKPCSRNSAGGRLQAPVEMVAKQSNSIWEWPSMVECKRRVSHLCAWWLTLVWLCVESAAYAATTAEQEKYLKLANESFQEVASGKVRDVDALIHKQEQLVAIGAAHCRKYAKIYPEDAKFLHLVADSAKGMSQMTPEEITRQWYRLEAPKAQGIDVKHDNHFEELINLMDLVVHPSYVIIVMKQYKQKPDKALLKRAKYELGELISHAEILFEKRPHH
ncbi:MAG: hypothetical protein AB1810_14720 [Pseudomonadota bacterium]